MSTTDTYADLPVWLYQGARVAEYLPRNWRTSNVLQVSTVARLTARYVVLDNGNRYHRATLREMGDPYGYELRPPDDRGVRAALAWRAVNKLESAVLRAFKAASQAPDRGTQDAHRVVAAILSAARCAAADLLPDAPRALVGSVEAVPEITYEDAGRAMIAEVNDEGASWFARIQSYDEGAEPHHPVEALIAGKRVRVTVEVLAEEGS